MFVMENIRPTRIPDAFRESYTIQTCSSWYFAKSGSWSQKMLWKLLRRLDFLKETLCYLQRNLRHARHAFFCEKYSRIRSRFCAPNIFSMYHIEIHGKNIRCKKTRTESTTFFTKKIHVERNSFHSASRLQGSVGAEHPTHTPVVRSDRNRRFRRACWWRIVARQRDNTTVR